MKLDEATRDEIAILLLTLTAATAAAEAARASVPMRAHLLTIADHAQKLLDRLGVLEPLLETP